ncbi:MAG TPA: tubulin-like doman-containing protein [Spirochaetota bacterium]|nr:tubulin-like doman-containing protein [Spirochaetota bacterium]
MAFVNPTIKPAIFIGLGSTGTQVLNYIREFMYEEFGVAGFPVFHFLSISTDGQDETDRQFGIVTQPFERMYEFKIYVPELEGPRAKLDKKNETFFATYSGMHEWFDMDTLKDNRSTVKAGAGGNRQVGRMALWMNWDQFDKHLSQCVDINKDARKDQMRDILRTYREQKGGNITIDSDLDNAVDVYIVTSLSGGSGSSAFIDVAVAAKRKLSQYFSNLSIYGFFTAMDHTLNDPSHASNCSNTLASLIELDNLHRKGIKIQYPDLPMQTYEDPFSQVYLMTPSISNEENWSSSVAMHGEKDQDVMRRLMALQVFLSAASGSLIDLGHKINVDIAAMAKGYDLPKAPPDPGFRRFINVMGLYAIWFPKNRILDSASYLLIHDLLRDWLGNEDQTTIHKADVQKKAADDYTRIESKALGELVADDKRNLDSDLMSRLQDVRVSLMAEDGDADTLKNKLLTEWGRVEYSNRSLTQEFGSNSHLSEFMNGRAVSMRTSFVTEVKKTVWSKVEEFVKPGEKDLTSRMTLEDTKEWVSSFKTELSQKIEHGYPDTPPRVDIASLDFERVYKVSFWSRITFQKKKAIRKNKEKLYSAFRKKVEDAWRGMKGYHAGRALQQSVKELDESIDKDLTKIKDRLSQLAYDAEKGFQDSCKLEMSENRILIMTMRGGKIKEDAEFIREQVGRISQELLQKKNADEYLFTRVFLRKMESEKLSVMQQIEQNSMDIKEERSVVLELIRNKLKHIILREYWKEISGDFSLTKEYLRRHRANILDHYKNSYILAAMSPTWSKLPLKDRPIFAGGGGVHGDDTIKDVLQIVREKDRSAIWEHSFETAEHLDNLIFFARQYPGVAVSDLKLYDEFKPVYESNPSGKVSNHHTSIRPRQFWPTSPWKYDMPALFALIGDAAGLFEQTKDGYAFAYKDGKKEYSILLKNCRFDETTLERAGDMDAWEKSASEAAEVLREKLLAADKEKEFDNRVRSAVIIIKQEQLYEKANQIKSRLIDNGVFDHEQAEEFKNRLYNFVDFMFPKM